MPKPKFVAVALDADSCQTVKMENSPAGDGAIRIHGSNGDSIDLWVSDLKKILKELEGWQES